MYVQRNSYLRHQTVQLVEELKRIEDVEAAGGSILVVATTTSVTPPQYNSSSTPGSDTSDYNNELINAISHELRDLDRSFSSSDQVVISDIEVEPGGEFVAEIYDIYRKFNPAKLSTVAELLQKYKGREQVQ